MTLETLARTGEELVTASRDTPVQELARMMDDSTVGCVIVERNGEAVGIVTDRDIALEVVGGGLDVDDTTARDVMTADPVVADEDVGVAELIRSMRDASVRRMPVVDDGELIGIITLDDLFVLIEDEMKDLSEVIRAEAPPY